MSGLPKGRLKHAEIGNLTNRRPGPTRIRDIRLPIDRESPFTATEEMAYAKILGSFRSRLRQTHQSIEQHEDSLYKRLSNELGSGLYQSGIPFPERSPPGIRLSKAAQFLQKGTLHLILRHADGIEPRLIYKHFGSRCKNWGGIVPFWLRGRELVPALWSLDHKGPSIFDFWTTGENFVHQTAITNKVNENDGYLLFGFLKHQLENDNLPRLLDDCKDELDLVAAVVQADFIGGSEGLAKVIAKLSTPWKLHEDQVQNFVLPDILNKLAKHGLAHGSLGPGQKLYVT
jgi:hypothetical protein